MALNVSALSVYTDQIEMGLAKEIILGANTLKGNIVSIKYGAVGDKVSLNLVKSTMYGVTSACGAFTDTDSTVMAQTNVQMCPIKFEQSICLDTLKKYYYDFYMEQKFNTESLGKFEDIFVQNKLEATALEIDKILWRGEKLSPAYATVTGNLTLCSGFLSAAYANSATTINIALTAVTAANAISYVDNIVASASTSAPAILDNFNIYLSPADFQSYLSGLRTLNLFHYDVSQKDKDVSEIHHPGSIGATVIKTNGLNGAASGAFIATPKDNIWAVVSAEEDLSFKMWFSVENDALEMRAKLKIGAGFYQPELVIVGR